MESTGTETALETPLAEIHRQAGAKLGVWFGCTLPDDFGDWQREYLLATQNVALIDKNYRAYASFMGPDRVRYVNAILTNNIKDLEATQGNLSLLLNPQGRILAEIETHAQLDRLFCISYAMIRERLLETLEKFIIMDDVTLTDDTQGYGTLAIEGPGAAKLVLELTGIDLAKSSAFATTPTTVDSLPCSITRKSFGPMAAADILAPRKNLESLWKIVLEKTKAAGGGPIGYTALNAVRLAQGIPWFGYDFGEKQIPHEAGLQDSHISYTKGCYTGQEIVERVRSRGQVNRRRVDLVFIGPRVPSAGEILTSEGQAVGVVTRASALPCKPFAIGMGYLRKENNAPGSQVDWVGGTAKVATFPDEL